MSEKRECKDCRLCCLVLGVKDLSKPPYKWCGLACDSGCSVFGDPNRPESCVQFQCLWLQDGGSIFTEDEKPNRIGLVLTSVVDGGVERLIAHVWRPRKQAWRLIARLRNQRDVLLVEEGMAPGTFRLLPKWPPRRFQLGVPVSK